MFALSMFVVFMSRRIDCAKPKAIHHYFSSEAPAGHIADESEVAYWKLPEHY
jgi:hypothetical protein